MAGHIDIDHGKMDDCPNACASTWAQRCQPFDTMPCNLMPFIHRSYMPLNGRKMDPNIFGSTRTRFRRPAQHFPTFSGCGHQPILENPKIQNLVYTMPCSIKRCFRVAPHRLAFILLLGDYEEPENGCQHQHHGCRVTLYGPPAAKRVEEPKRPTGFARDVEKETV